MKLTGFSIRSGKPVSFQQLTDNSLPSYKIDMMTVESGGKQVKRICFVICNISEQIALRVKALFDSGTFKPSSKFTLLPDTTIMIGLGGDKGGTEFQFKFGLTVLNCENPNSPDAFDLIGTLEAFDTYPNMKNTIFKFLKDELEALFSEKPLPLCTC